MVVSNGGSGFQRFLRDNNIKQANHQVKRANCSLDKVSLNKIRMNMKHITHKGTDAAQGECLFRLRQKRRVIDFLKTILVVLNGVDNERELCFRNFTAENIVTYPDYTCNSESKDGSRICIKRIILMIMW